MGHQADHGKGDHGFGHLGQVLVIFGQTPPTAKPAECAFDHPPPWQHDKTLRAWNAADDDQRDAEQEAGELAETARRFAAVAATRL